MKKDNISYLNGLAQRLEQHRITSARPEAELLLSHFGGLNRLDLYAGNGEITEATRAQIDRAVEARAAGEPLQYILGRVDFFGRSFEVNPDALIPRPETELLVEQALGVLAEHYQGRGAEILDIGTGSGCVAASLTLERPDSRMTALDICPRALGVARNNLKHHGLEYKVRLLRSDLFSEFAGRTLKPAWDLIVSNPPYIPEDEIDTLPREVLAEPRKALNGGAAGLALIHQLLAQAPFFLKSGGWLLMEIGLGQSGALADKISGDRLYRNLRFVRDHAGIDRVLVVQKNG